MYVKPRIRHFTQNHLNTLRGQLTTLFLKIRFLKDIVNTPEQQHARFFAKQTAEKTLFTREDTIYYVPLPFILPFCSVPFSVVRNTKCKCLHRKMTVQRKRSVNFLLAVPTGKTNLIFHCTSVYLLTRPKK